MRLVPKERKRSALSPFYYEEEWRKYIPFTQKAKAIFIRKGVGWGTGIEITKKEIEKTLKEGTPTERAELAEDMLKKHLTEELRESDMDYYRKSLKSLAMDTSVEVRRALLSLIPYDSDMDNSLFDWEPYAADVVKILSKDRDPTIRRDIAEIKWRLGYENREKRDREVCEIMKSLAQDKEVVVRKEVASNPTIPNQCACDILKDLSDDQSDLVITELLLNSIMRDNCPGYISDLVVKQQSSVGTHVRMGEPVSGNSFN